MANITTNSLNPIMEVELKNGAIKTNADSPALVENKEYTLVFRYLDTLKAPRIVNAVATKIDNDICLGNYHLDNPEKPDTSEDYCYIYKEDKSLVVKDTNAEVADYVWLCKPVVTSNTFVVDGIDKLFVKAPNGKVFQITVNNEGVLATMEAI